MDRRARRGDTCRGALREPIVPASNDVDLDHLSRTCADALRSRLAHEASAAPVRLLELESPGYTSRRFKILLSDGPEAPYCLKLFHLSQFSEPHIREVVRREYCGLKIVHHHLWNHPEFHVPRPVCYSASGHFVIMEFVNGTNLATKLNERLHPTGILRDHDSMGEMFQRAGRFLYTLQDISFRLRKGPTPRTRAVVHYYQSTFSSSVANCLGRSGHRGFLSRLPDEVLPRLDQMFTRNVELCYQHHDYRPQNLIVGQKTTLLDFPLFRHGSPYFDLACFIWSVRYLCLWTPLWLRAMGRLETSFLEGYLERYDRPVPFSRGKLDLFLKMLYPWVYNLFLETLQSRRSKWGVLGRWGMLGRLPQQFLSRALQQRLSFTTGHGVPDGI